MQVGLHQDVVRERHVFLKENTRLRNKMLKASKGDNKSQLVAEMFLKCMIGKGYIVCLCYRPSQAKTMGEQIMSGSPDTGAPQSGVQK